MSAENSLQNLFDTIEEAVADIRAGKMVIVVDSEDRENEGDIVMAAEDMTPDAVNFIITNARGLLCAPMPSARLRALELDQMVETSQNNARLGTRFTVSIDILDGATTGISASDRAKTLQALADRKTKPAAFGRPGHIFPLEAAAGGLAERPGHTEAVVELCKLAGKQPVGALCEILSDDGTMARTPELRKKADQWGLKLVSVEALTRYLQERNILEAVVTTNGHATLAVDEPEDRSEIIVERVVEADLPTHFGDFRLHVFNSPLDGKEHLAITKGEIDGKENVLTRIHSECLTGDTLGSARCDCGPQLQMALKRIEGAGQGIVLYMRQEGRGIGLTNKIKAYALQDKGADTVEANIQLGFAADQRDYRICAGMLNALGVKSVSVMTNNPRKIAGLVQGGIVVNDRRSAETTPTDINHNYLRTKRDKLGHLLRALEPAGNGNSNGNGNGNGNGTSSAARNDVTRLTGSDNRNGHTVTPVIPTIKNESE